MVSGGGSNLEAILQSQETGALGSAQVALVLSSKADAFALARARNHRIATAIVERKAYPDENAFQAAVLKALREAQTDVVCLAVYLRLVGPDIVAAYRGRILNIHPALLPKFGGAGMYGHFVHEAVLKAGDKESGCSVHVVDEVFDHGPVLAQVRVPVMPGDTPETLAARVLAEEHKLYPRTIREFCEKLSPHPTLSLKGEGQAKPGVRGGIQP
jgi:phosphoribosylglycinamide formyltransferase 1